MQNVQHFYLTEGHSIEDFTITGIVGLVNPPNNSEKKLESWVILRATGKSNL